MKTENWTERLLTQSSNVVPELARQIFETISEFSADQIWRPDTPFGRAFPHNRRRPLFSFIFDETSDLQLGPAPGISESYATAADITLMLSNSFRK